MPEPIDPRDFGRLEARVESLERMLQQYVSALATMNERLTNIDQTLSEARGGWKTMMWIGGAGASAGGLITWVLNHVSFK